MWQIKIRFRTRAGLKTGTYKIQRAGSVKPPLHMLGGAGGLFGRGRGNRWWRDAARTAGGALLALMRKLFLALQFFVEAHSLILDDRVLHAETPFEFVDKLAVIGAHLLVDVNTFAVLGDFVGELARAPVLGLFDLAALFGDGMFDGGEDLLDFVFRCRRAGDENQIVQTFFHDDLVSSCSGRLAREKQNQILRGFRQKAGGRKNRESPSFWALNVGAKAPTP